MDTVVKCHWIPLSSGEECVDCPPICRGKQRTLLLPLYLIGMVLLIGSYPLVWVNLVAIANNQSPESVQVSAHSIGTCIAIDIIMNVLIIMAIIIITLIFLSCRAL